jgi:hypothetical protein
LEESNYAGQPRCRRSCSRTQVERGWVAGRVLRGAGGGAATPGGCSVSGTPPPPGAGRRRWGLPPSRSPPPAAHLELPARAALHRRLQRLEGEPLGPLAEQRPGREHGTWEGGGVGGSQWTCDPPHPSRPCTTRPTAGRLPHLSPPPIRGASPYTASSCCSCSGRLRSSGAGCFAGDDCSAAAARADEPRVVFLALDGCGGDAAGGLRAPAALSTAGRLPPAASNIASPRRFRVALIAAQRAVPPLFRRRCSCRPSGLRAADLRELRNFNF